MNARVAETWKPIADGVRPAAVSRRSWVTAAIQCTATRGTTGGKRSARGLQSTDRGHGQPTRCTRCYAPCATSSSATRFGVLKPSPRWGLRARPSASPERADGGLLAARAACATTTPRLSRTHRVAQIPASARPATIRVHDRVAHKPPRGMRSPKSEPRPRMRSRGSRLQPGTRRSRQTSGLYSTRGHETHRPAQRVIRWHMSASPLAIPARWRRSSYSEVYRGGRRRSAALQAQRTRHASARPSC